MAKTSALSSGGEAIHTRTDGGGTSESQVVVLGIDGSDSVVPADTTGVAVRGNVAHHGVDSGNPVKVGGTFNTASPGLDDGDRGDLQLDNGGSLFVATRNDGSSVRVTGNVSVAGGGVAGSEDEGATLKVGGVYHATQPTLDDFDLGDLELDSRSNLRVTLMTKDGVTAATVPVTIASLPALAAGSANIGDVDVLTVPAPLSTTGSGTEATAQRVTIATDSTGVLSVDDNGGSLTVDNATISVVGSGTEATAQRVTIATDSTGVLSVDDNGGNLSIDDGGNSITVDNATISVVGSGTEATAQRVTIATDSTGVLSVDDNGGALTIDSTQLPAALAANGGLKIEGVASGVAVPISLTTLPAGTNNIGDVDVLTLPGALTGKAEDTASGPADVGLPILGVRNDTPSSLTGTDGDYTMVAVDQYGRVQVAPVRSLPKTVGVTGSLGITTAATWDERAVWAVPASTLFAPKIARAAVTTASTRTLILAGKQLATFNPGTNTFAATGSVTGNDFYDRLMYRIAVTHSATATNVTATYTDQDGNTGNSTGALAIPSAAVAGDWYEFIYAANDFGVKAVTAVSDSANPTTVVDEIWGFRTLLEDLGTAITPHIAYLGEGLQVPTGESIVILFNAAATTAQQRFAFITGDLVAA